MDICEKKTRFSVIAENLYNITQAHIHVGENGENESVIVLLYPHDMQESELLDEMLA